MQENFRIIRVFIGSPGGLNIEREAAHTIVKEINQQNADHWGMLFKLLGWEEAIPGYQRAQDKINEDLDRCDYFIGVMWNKWGSRPSNDPNGYTSGFEEEYHRSVQRFEAGLMKDIALFFKSIEVPPGMTPGPEIKKVLDFRQKCIDEKKIFFQDFDEIDSFKAAVRAKIVEIGWREFTHRAITEGENEEDDQPPMVETGSGRSAPSASGLLDEEAKRFLSEVLDKSAEWDDTEPSEVARLRLIAASISRSGNDELHLGTHDANLVFRHYRNAELSDQEITALLDCGVAGFEHQNVPLWRWMTKINQGGDHLYRLRVLATVGTVSEQVGAIRILQLFGSAIPTHDGEYDKSGVLTEWLSAETEPSVLDAITSFLGTNGSEEDIALIEAASANLPRFRKYQADAAIVEIISKRSIEDALKYICERQVTGIEKNLAIRLLANPQSLTTEVLALCLSAKSDEIRIGAANALFERGEIDQERAKDLLTDDSVELRLVAAETLYQEGKELDDDVLKKVLKTQRQVFSLSGVSGETDETQLEIYRANRRAELSPSELVKQSDNDFLQYKCLETLFQLHPKKAVSRIKEGLEDSFSGYFAKSTAGFREKFAAESNALEIVDQVVPSYQSTLCNAAVKALCSLRKPEDLNLLRRCLDSMDIVADASIIKFLGRFGEWQDTSRLLKLGEKREASLNALRIPSASFAEERAAALLSIGKKRIVDLLGLDMNIWVRTNLLKQIPNSKFVSMSDEVLLRELAHDSAECRAIVALRCVQALPRSRVEGLLDSYIDHDNYRFYNSIHWLDLGASLPKTLSRDLASKELANR